MTHPSLGSSLRSTVIAHTVFLFLLLVSVVEAQISPPAKSDAASTSDSQEAFVIEQFIRKEKFENDGTSQRQDTASIRIQSEAGLQRYGLLNFSYASATGTFEIVYVRARKPDGSVVETPLDSVQDMAAQITREAPFYSDLHEKHLAVKGLSVGDELEFQTSEHTTKPLAPGQFWEEYSFTKGEIVRDEQLQISVPRARAVKVKTAGTQPTIREEGSERIYFWHHENLGREDHSDKRKITELAWQQARGRLPQVDIRLSSFGSWEEVGRWYEGLQSERVKPIPEVVAKAQELIKGAANDEARIRALYSYVGTQFRYIGIAFGIGRYQPHGAGEVLSNQYGDCKDKHTLLASLLTAVHIPAYPALISSHREIDPDIPSPGQFNHVITVVPRDSGLVWLDTTAEIAPYQYLTPQLRDKQALVIWAGKQAALGNTPADPPYPASQTFHMTAKLSDSGTLEGHTDVSARGDLEFFLRSGFRAVALAQWKELAQQISYGSGFGGDVSEVNAGSPEKTDEPFHFEYKYTRKDFGDWPNRRIVVPSPVMALPASADEERLPMGPLWLGSPQEINANAEVEVPTGYRADVPETIHLKKDFAEYDASYDFKEGKLISKRRLKTLLHEVPAGEREDYKEFAKKVQDDYGLFISFTSVRESQATASQPKSLRLPSSKTFDAIRNLPDSPSAEAVRLEKEARSALEKHDVQGALTALYRATAADSQFTRAWVLLGGLLLSSKQIDAGLEAFHKAIAAAPSEPAIPKMLGMGLMASAQFEAAVSAWQDFLKTQPDDFDGNMNLGHSLVQVKRYSEAAAAFETAAKTHADRADVEVNLASAYLLGGEDEKASQTYQKLADTKPSQTILNNAAYQMAQHKALLPQALDFAKKAVTMAEEQSQKITLAALSMEDVRQIDSLMAYWDTLGWVLAENSTLDEAAVYLHAAWKLTQDGIVGNHLCQVYERMHKTELAIRACRMAVFRMPMASLSTASEAGKEMEDAQKRLKRLTQGTAKQKSDSEAADLVISERSFKLPRFLQGTEPAEFFLLFSADGKSKSFKVDDVKFVSGSDKMKTQGKQLKAIDFGFPAPGQGLSRFVRRGILGCYQYSGCSFVLLDPEAVHSVN